MRQQVFSWRDKFHIKDERGDDRYYVEGEIFALGKKLHVFDSAGREVAFIRQKLLALLPKYYIEIGGGTIEIVKEFTLLKPRFRFNGLPWTLQGDFWAHEYTLSDGGRVVMQLSKRWLTWGDTYELDIADTNNELLCLCVALAVDCVLDNAEQARRSSH
ncbi:MAG: LURP-one-related family protein [Oscillospiraceae bacterium]|nr:LURP-one-related family protein [Oscillospiraceae bacterium]